MGKLRFTFGLGCTAVVALIAILLCSCKREVRFTPTDNLPEIFPDYKGVTIPASMAVDDGSLFTFEMQNGEECKVERHREGDVIWCTVSAWPKGSTEGVRYKAFPIYVSRDEIDPYVAYRLIEPGYESWSNISICQRRLDSYEERAIVTNKVNEKGCINCHTFDRSRKGRMLFHSRGKINGTMIVEDGKTKVVDFKAIGPKKQPTYPAWHPTGRFVAFSSNDTQQCFMLHGQQPIEVYDNASDIILYDTEKGTVTADSALNTKAVWETFPTWSPDGRRLYYCAADSVLHPSTDRSRLHYRLMYIDFDSEQGLFIGNPHEVRLEGLDMTEHSVSHPRIFGRHLMFTLTDYGTFPIWHDEADLWLLNLETGEVRPCDELNSHRADSYHSWSSNGKWVVFGSRRLDGRYTHLYFSHFDEKGRFSKPFLLPQDEPEQNRLRLKSYNIPEFVTEEVEKVEK